jgi:hypothetical protein
MRALPMTLQSRRQVWYTDGPRITGGPGTGVCAVRRMRRLSFSLDVHVRVFWPVQGTTQRGSDHRRAMYIS